MRYIASETSLQTPHQHVLANADLPAFTLSPVGIHDGSLARKLDKFGAGEMVGLLVTVTDVSRRNDRKDVGCGRTPIRTRVGGRVVIGGGV